MGLKDRSKKPQKSPRMMKMYWQFKIKALAEKATADNKRISSTGTAMFIYRLFTHLKHYGVKPAEITIQTDNGTEVTAPWNSPKNNGLH